MPRVNACIITILPHVGGPGVATCAMEVIYGPYEYNIVHALAGMQINTKSLVISHL